MGPSQKYINYFIVSIWPWKLLQYWNPFPMENHGKPWNLPFCTHSLPSNHHWLAMGPQQPSPSPLIVRGKNKASSSVFASHHSVVRCRALQSSATNQQWGGGRSKENENKGTAALHICHFCHDFEKSLYVSFYLQKNVIVFGGRVSRDFCYFFQGKLVHLYLHHSSSPWFPSYELW